jgi:hypothetical protein
VSTLRYLAVGVLTSVAVACASRDASRVDSAEGTVAIDSTTGEVVFQDVKYPLTSDNFKKFSVAQEALDALPEPPVVQRIDVQNPREADVVLVVKQLEDDAAARAAIENAGMTVRDFVLTSLALGQAMAFLTDSRVPVGDANRAFLTENQVSVEQLEARRRFRIDDAGGRGSHDVDRGKRKKHKEKGKKGRGH